MISSPSAPPAPRAPAWEAHHPAPVHPRRRVVEQLVAGIGRTAEEGFVLVALFVFSHSLLPLLVLGGETEVDLSQGDPTLRRVFSAVHALVLLVCAVRWREWWGVARREGWSLALLGLALLSVAWSEVPDLTLRRGLALLGTTAFGVFLAARYDLRPLLVRVGVVLGFNALLSALLAVAVPSLGVESEIHVGAWRGAFTQKNTLGVTMAASALVLVLLWRSGGRGRRLAAAGAALSAALVLLSTSKTSLVLLCTVLAVLPLYNLLRSRHGFAVPFLILAIVAVGAAAVLALVYRETVLVALGRDATLTGRTDVWSSAIAAGSAHPWLGHGYAGFWLGAEGPSLRVWQEAGWEAPNSHNGYLDLWLDLGWAGVALFAAGFVVALSRSVALVRRVPRVEALWPLAYLTFVPLYNVSESALLRQNSIFWVLFVAAAVTAAARTRSPSGPERAVVP